MNNLKEVLNRMTVGKAALLGVILAAFYYWIFFDSGMSQKTAIETSQKKISDLQKQIKDAQTKLDRAAVYKKTAAEVGTTINKLLAVIPEHFDSSDLMKIISNEVKVAGSSLASISPGPVEISTVAKEFEEFPVTLDLSGSFMQHMVLLSNLTKIQQILIVRKFALTTIKEGKSEEATVVHLEAEIVAYRYRGSVTPPTEPPPPGGAPPK